VKVTNNSTGIQLSTVTTNAGVYRFPSLTVVGTYFRGHGLALGPYTIYAEK